MIQEGEVSPSLRPPTGPGFSGSACAPPGPVLGVLRYPLFRGQKSSISAVWAVSDGVSGITTPYDTLFRTTFADPQTARELTLFLLPGAHARRPAGEREEHRDGLLPEILPVVLYHGTERWNAPLQFADLISGGADSPHVSHYHPVFANLAEIPDGRITGSLRAMLGPVALKHARLRLQRAAADLLTELLHRGEADPAVRHLARVVEQVYVKVKSAAEAQRLMTAASQSGCPEVEGGYMTYAQELLEQGVEKGSLQRVPRVFRRGFLRYSLTFSFVAL